MPQRTAVVGGEDTAHRRPVGERRIERQPLPVLRQRAVHIAQSSAGLDGRRHVAVLMLEDAVQPPHVEDRVDASQRPAPIALRARAANDERVATLGCVAERGGHFLGGRRHDHDGVGSGLQDSFFEPYMRSARPAASTGCWR